MVRIVVAKSSAGCYCFASLISSQREQLLMATFMYECNIFDFVVITSTDTDTAENHIYNLKKLELVWQSVYTNQLTFAS